MGATRSLVLLVGFFVCLSYIACTKSPALHYTFVEADGLLQDHGRRKLHGTLQNSSTCGPHYTHFDGEDDFVEVPPELQFIGELTVSVLVRYKSVNNWAKVVDFAAKDDNGRVTHNVFLGRVEESDACWFGFFDLLLPDNVAYVRVEDCLHLGEWVHLVGTISRRNTAIRLYRNGVLHAELLKEVPPVAHTWTHSAVGAAVDGEQPAAQFCGDLADLRVFDQLLSPVDVHRLYWESRFVSLSYPPLPPSLFRPKRKDVCHVTNAIPLPHTCPLLRPWPTATTAVVYAYHESERAYRNLDFFLRVGVRAADRVDFFFVIQGYKLSVPMPAYPNVHILRRQNTNRDFGAYRHAIETIHRWHNWRGTTLNSNVTCVAATMGLCVDELPYQNFIFLNSGVRGPLLPAYFPPTAHWTQAFVSKFDATVKLVGTSLVCLPVYSSQGFEGPALEGMAFAMDRKGLQLVWEGGALQMGTEGEMWVSRCVLDAGYNQRSLLYRYPNVDWRNRKTWHCNEHRYASRKDGYDGINISPIEVVFHKGFWNDSPMARVSWTEQELYTKWAMDAQNRIQVKEEFARFAKTGTPDFDAQDGEETLAGEHGDAEEDSTEEDEDDDEDGEEEEEEEEEEEGEEAEEKVEEAKEEEVDFSRSVKTSDKQQSDTSEITANSTQQRVVIMYAWSAHMMGHTHEDEDRAKENLLFFLSHGIQLDDTVLYHFVLEGTVDTCPFDLPSASSVLVTENSAVSSDVFAAYGVGIDALLEHAGVDSVAKLPFSHLLFLNAGVRGPFLSPSFPAGLHWHTVFTGLLVGDVKAVGTTVACLPATHPLGRGPAFEGYAVAIALGQQDEHSLLTRLDALGVFARSRLGVDGEPVTSTTTTVETHEVSDTEVDEVTVTTVRVSHRKHRERPYARSCLRGGAAVARAVLAEGYDVRSLLLKQQQVDWRESAMYLSPEDRLCPEAPSHASGYDDGVDVHPFEVVFHRSSHDAHSPAVMGREEDVYTLWARDSFLRGQDSKYLSV